MTLRETGRKTFIGLQIKEEKKERKSRNPENRDPPISDIYFQPNVLNYSEMKCLALRHNPLS